MSRYLTVLTLIDPLLRPASRTRWVCLLLLITLATSMLLLGARPEASGVIPNPPWDKLLHVLVFGGYGALAWVVLRGRSEAWAVAVVGLIALMDEGMQWYSPGRSADFKDILADLTGGLIVVMVLKFMLIATNRRSQVQA